MSTSTMAEPFDTPMADFNEDSDIPMVGGLGDHWFSMTRMDEDGQIHFDNYSHAESLEVDMLAYEETAEYEMGDDVIDHAGSEALDTDVIDVSLVPSPAPPPVQELPQHVEDEGATPVHELPSGPIQRTVSSHEGQLTLPLSVGATAPFPSLVSDGVIAQEPTTASTSLNHVTVPDPAIEPYAELDPNNGDGSVRTGDLPPAESVGVGSAEHKQPSSEHIAPENADIDSREENLNTNLEVVAADRPATEHTPPARGNTLIEERAGSTFTEAGHDEYATYGSSTSEIVEQPQDDVLATSSEENTDSQVTENAPTDHQLAPENELMTVSPAILLTLRVTSSEGDQPEFVLFSPPDSAESSSAAQQPSEDPLVLLQHHSSLYYEPISTVFEAFRQEEYFSHLDELTNAEMSLNAYDLQLVISEDNIYAREVSLHDLVAMHRGVGLPGHLRLSLQSVVPRFIARYNFLREQITRLSLTEEAEETHQAQVEAEKSGQDDEGKSAGQASILQQGEEVQNDVEKTREATPQSSEQEQHDGQAPEGEDQEDEDAQGETDTDEDGNEVESNVGKEANVEERGAEEQGQAPYEDGFGGEDDEDEQDLDGVLDAAGVHENGIAKNAPNDASYDVDEEHATEYNDTVGHYDDDDEDLGDEFGEEGTENIGTSGETSANSFLSVEDATNVAQAEALSHSLSASSAESGESSWDEEQQHVPVDPHTKQETTDNPSQKAVMTHDEGNLQEEDDEFGDDEFGDDDFPEEVASTEEGTLEGSTEEAPLDFDVALPPALYEYEKLATDIDDDEASAKKSPGALTDAEKNAPKSGDFAITHTNVSKRSLDDAELEEEFFDSSTSSPHSKRARVL